MTTTTLESLLQNEMPHDRRVLLHAGPSLSPLLLETLRHDPALAANRTFTGLFIPGLLPFDLATLTPTTRVETLFVTPDQTATFRDGRTALLPLHYSHVPDYFTRNPADLAILHLPPPRDGVFSCGLTADIADGVRAYARKIAVLVNPQIPFTHGAVALAESDTDFLIDADGPLLAIPADLGTDNVTQAIANHVAGLVRDGDALQFGIGRVQTAILSALKHHRRLCVRSGMITDALVELHGSGALTAPAAHAPVVITGFAAGGESLHEFCRRPDVEFHGNRITHNPLHIAAIKNFTAINSALEIDLLGQINCESINGRQVSGIGGGGDFLRAARLAPGGRAITALPSHHKGRSRIVPLLAAGAASMARADADIVVTEHGVAQLRDLDCDARAQALIAVAAPDHRNALANAWEQFRAAS
ncbi:MAG: acetyl-CoA hydrolase/transferase family protein [Beijerinckiaceae bacterium]